MTNSPFFTIFTPTYNRAHTLHRVFESLSAQTLQDFEWVIVDDGSTDATAELVANWSKAASFRVRYFKQKNAGKHVAHNLALREAEGRLFVPLDSDDALVPDALASMAASWNDIPVARQGEFSGMWGLCRDQHGTVVGDYYPASPFDANLRDVVYTRRLGGERWAAMRTDVLREFPFPELPNTIFLPEGLIWLQIARKYKTRFVNGVLRIYFVNDACTGATLTGQRWRNESAPGRLYFCAWLLDNDIEYFWRSPSSFVKAALMLPAAAWQSGHSITSAICSLKRLPARALVCALLPISAILLTINQMWRA